MEELIIAMARGLVEEPDKVSVTTDPENEEGEIVYHLIVAENDKGRVIGKSGRIAKSIRTIARSAASRRGITISVEID